MGTRGSVGFIYKNEYKACYNHYDSYPTGLGESVASFIALAREDNSWEKLKVAVEKLIMVDESTKPGPKEIKKYKKFANTSVSTGDLTEWYVLLRDLQNGRILFEILSGKVGHMIDGREFIKDSLFCEWAYIINLDTMKLEIYRGFQQEPSEGNRFGQKQDGNYYPCKMIKEVSLKRNFGKELMKKLEKEAYK